MRYIQALLQNAAGENGNGDTLDVANYSSLCLDVKGTFTATVNFEARVSSATWVAIQGVDISDDTTKATTATAAGTYRFNVEGILEVRARVSGYSSGAVTVTAFAQV